jgi:hypothetical protein
MSLFFFFFLLYFLIRLYAIYLAADEIFKNSWHLSSTRFISPLMRSSKFVTSRLYAIYLAADEIFKMHDISALRDLYRRRWDLQNLWHLGSTRFISPPMRFLQFVTSRLYAIYIVADKIFKFCIILALRDLYRRRWDFYGLWHLGSARFISPSVRFLRFVTSQL